MKIGPIKGYAVWCEEVGFCVAYQTRKEAKEDELNRCAGSHRIIAVSIAPLLTKKKQQ